ncbi:MAG TPA: 50S ribosomal protein L29 [Candidatus Acidoferrales bacterium]|nr:50S ribosomal protein L29 [Candidatus Acidoferrales bacterium]
MTHRIDKIREMDRNELEIQERELGDQIFRLRFQLTTGQTESVKKMREAKKDLARVKTIMRQMELKQSANGGAEKTASAKTRTADAK